MTQSLARESLHTPGAHGMMRFLFPLFKMIFKPDAAGGESAAKAAR